MTIPVVKETYHTQCIVFVCNRWRYKIPKGERRHENTSSKRNLSYTKCRVCVQHMVIPNT
jgi:hypothetical protein